MMKMLKKEAMYIPLKNIIFPAVQELILATSKISI
jgi:hypothetical protein